MQLRQQKTDEICESEIFISHCIIIADLRKWKRNWVRIIAREIYYSFFAFHFVLGLTWTQSCFNHTDFVTFSFGCELVISTFENFSLKCGKSIVQKRIKKYCWKSKILQ